MQNLQDCQEPAEFNLISEFHKLWRNINLVKIGTKYSMIVGYLYRTNPLITFAPQNSNFIKIRNKTKALVQRLLKQNRFQVIDDEVKKKIELDKILASPHHFSQCAHSLEPDIHVYPIKIYQ